MIVTSVPRRLRLAVGALFFSLPWIVLEVMITTRSGWGSIPWITVGYWIIAFLLIYLPLANWLISANRWAYHLTVCLSALWVCINLGLSYRLELPTLGFFTLALGFYLGVVLGWLKFELSRSFYNSGLCWYQGMPKPIPGLKCRLISGEESSEVRVSHMDREGVFIYTADSGTRRVRQHQGARSEFNQLLSKKQLSLLFQYRGMKLSCEGIPTLLIERSSGAGIRFNHPSPDLQKEIGDFVELLRGEGYGCW